MATPHKNQSDQAVEQEPVEAPEAAEATRSHALKEQADEIAKTIDKARAELHEAVGKIREEAAKVDVKKAQQQAQTWVKENPTLAVLLAVGAGLVVGKLVSSALKSSPPPPPPPPTLSQRLKTGTHNLASQAQHLVREKGGDVSEVISRRARELGDDFAKRARELGEDVTRQATEALHQASDYTGDLRETLRDEVEELSSRHLPVKTFDVPETLFNAAKTVTAAIVVKKVTDWLRRLT